MLFRVLVVAADHEPTFFPKTDPLKGPLEAKVKPRSTADIPLKNIIRARVVDRTGAPMARAVVSVDMVQQGNTGSGSPPAGTDPLALTDEEGRFALYSKQSFDYMTLKVEARAMAPKRFNEVRGGLAEKPLVVTEGASLKGRVLLDGKPVRDVSVGAVSVDRTMENFSGDFEYATKEDGSFSFPNLPPDREYFIYGMMKSFLKYGALPARKIRIGPDGTVTGAGDLKVESGYRLAGQLVLLDHKPIPPHTRLTIGRRDAWDTYAEELPEDGRFDVSNLPAESLSIGGRIEGYRFSGQNASLDRLNPFGLAGLLKENKTNLTVLMEPGDMLPSEWDPDPGAERPENQPLAGIENGARRALWVITGKIIDAETKGPITNARIIPGRAPGGRTNWVYWEGSRFALSTNGTYRLELPRAKDPKMFRAIAEGHLPAVSGLVNFTENESVVNFELAKGDGPSGTLLSVKGEPLAGTTVCFLGPGEQGGLTPDGQVMVHNSGDESKCITAPDGHFKFAAKLGDSEVYASTNEGFVHAKASEMKAGQPLQLRAWSKIRGILVKDGKPVGGEHLDLRWVEPFRADHPFLNLHGGVTDDSGKFEIDRVPPGPMMLTFRNSLGGGGGGWQSIPIKQFDAPPGEELNLGEIEKAEQNEARR